MQIDDSARPDVPTFNPSPGHLEVPRADVASRLTEFNLAIRPSSPSDMDERLACRLLVSCAASLARFSTAFGFCSAMPTIARPRSLLVTLEDRKLAVLS